MKKFIIALSIAALTVSAYAMSKTPADASACGTEKNCAVKEACPACTAAGGMCAVCKGKADATKACADKTATDAVKAVEEKAGCTGGVCPLKK